MAMQGMVMLEDLLVVYTIAPGKSVHDPVIDEMVWVPDYATVVLTDIPTGECQHTYVMARPFLKALAYGLQFDPPEVSEADYAEMESVQPVNKLLRFIP